MNSKDALRGGPVIHIDDAPDVEKRRRLSFHYAWSFFSISGKDMVRRKELKKEDFFLPDEVKPFKVAEYDPRRVAKYWNKMYLGQHMCRTIYKSFTRGLMLKCIPVTILYLLVFYTFNLFFATAILCTTSPPEPLNGTQKTHQLFPLSSVNSTCNLEKIKEWKGIEKDFTRILTFFIGFFVSFTIKNYFDQVKMIPRFDTLTMGLDTLLWVDPTKKQDEIKVKGQCTAKDLRMTIMRYCFLSWTMCLSRFSSKLGRHFSNAYAYNKKKLLIKREFEELKCGTNYETGTDHWLEKWSMPLLWANKMANDLDDIKTNTNDAKIKDIKEGVTTTVRRFQQSLGALNCYNKYPVPPAIIQILVFAIYAFLVVSAVTNQNVHDYENADQTQLVLFFFSDFPAFSIMKFLMLFGWLKTAADLQNPFGSEREHVDLIGFLDYEIWKISHLLAQDIPLQKPSEEFPTSEQWEDFGPRWNSTRVKKNNKQGKRQD